MWDKDKQIIKKILYGEGKYFEEIIEEYKDIVFKICMEFMKNEYDAMDMSQEVFIKIYNNLDKFKFKCKFSTWVYRVCVNTCLSELKKRERLNLPIEELNYCIGITPEEFLQCEEIKELIQDEIKVMSNKKKSILNLRMRYEYSFKKIAQILNITCSSARTEYSRAKSQIYECIEKYNKGE